jgi:hypothetical protein
MGDRMEKVWIRVIGDVHGYLHFRGSGRSYFNLIGQSEHSIQLGDLGFPYSKVPDFHKDLANIDKTRHVVVLGNHDDYTHRAQNALGDFGVHSFPLKEGKFEFFYIRGAYSIDREYRTIGVDWWAEEQLNWEQGKACVQAYEAAKPDVVFTHDCAEEVIHLLASDGKDRFFKDFRPSPTNRILQSCLERHRPKLWVFGHHHINWRKEDKGTTFICLNGHMPTIGHNMGYIDFDDMGQLITPFPK